jgi:hypothetical protein
MQADADALFHADLERRLAGRWAVRLATDEDAPFLAELFGQLQVESLERLGGDAFRCIEGPLLEFQREAQARAYQAAYPSASRYITTSREGRAIGHAIIDWSASAQPSVLVDVGVLPNARVGAPGLHVLRAWLATCDRLGRVARLQVLPHNPARILYKHLGFLEAEAAAFPICMQRPPSRRLAREQIDNRSLP